ncbi:MAG: M3 family metallopeptidase [Caldilineaceae bacterium]
MPSTYPFDPYDWTTITPLLQALIDAPVADGGFMPWLAQWNQLDIAIWDAYTVLKRPAYYDTRDQAAEEAYATYVQELFSTYLGLTNALLNRALTLQPAPPSPMYEQLWQRWQNQQALFQPASLPLQAKISQLESRYRSMMNGFEPERPVAYWLERRGELNELMFRLLELRRTLAQTSGEPTFLAYHWRQLNRLGYTVADCQAFHQAVETVVVPVVAQWRSHHTSATPSPEISDLMLLVDGVKRMLQQIDPSFGEVFQAMCDGDYLDIGPRPHKAGAVEEWFFPLAGLPHLQISTFNVGSVLHESGHGMHDYLSFGAHGSLWNLNGPEEFQEFAATSMDLLAWPFYAQAQGGPYTEEESGVARQSVLHYYLDALTTCTMQDAFEHWVYGEAHVDVTPADFDAKWLQLKQRFTPWEKCDPTSAEDQTGWQRWAWSLYRMPLYMITYPMAIVGACQFGRLVKGTG